MRSHLPNIYSSIQNLSDTSFRLLCADLKNNKIIMADPSESDENKEQLCAWHEFLKHDAYIERKERIKRKAQKKKEREAFAAGKSLNSAENPSLHAELSSDNDEGDQMVISALDVCKSIIYYATNLIIVGTPCRYIHTYTS